jgi:hypothetical protein
VIQTGLFENNINAFRQERRKEKMTMITIIGLAVALLFYRLSKVETKSGLDGRPLEAAAYGVAFLTILRMFYCHMPGILLGMVVGWLIFWIVAKNKK